jgi:hypothetical protein
MILSRTRTRIVLALLATVVALLTTSIVRVEVAAAAAARANLLVTASRLTPASVQAGASTTVRATVANRGSAAAPATKAVLLLSRDRARGAGDRTLARVDVRALAAGRTATLTRKVTISAATQARSWFLLTCADSLAKVRESSERDNCRAVALTVTAASTGGADPTTPVGGDPAAGQPPQRPGITFVRDDAAVQQQLAAAGNLLLERYSFGSTGQTASYWRIWLYASGQFVYNEISWNSVGGETCTASHRGTWSFLEGYTFAEQGGGLLFKVQVATPTINGVEIFTAGNAEPNNVYVGPQFVQYELNPNMQDNCAG